MDQENCVKVSDIILHPEESLLFLVFDYAEFELYVSLDMCVALV